jgi:hypothetical protein
MEKNELVKIFRKKVAKEGSREGKRIGRPEGLPEVELAGVVIRSDPA